MNKKTNSDKSKSNTRSNSSEKKPGKHSTFGNEPSIREPSKPAQPSEYEVDKNDP